MRSSSFCIMPFSSFRLGGTKNSFPKIQNPKPCHPERRPSLGEDESKDPENLSRLNADSGSSPTNPFL